MLRARAQPSLDLRVSHPQGTEPFDHLGLQDKGPWGLGDVLPTTQGQRSNSTRPRGLRGATSCSPRALRGICLRLRGPPELQPLPGGSWQPTGHSGPASHRLSARPWPSNSTEDKRLATESPWGCQATRVSVEWQVKRGQEAGPMLWARERTATLALRPRACAWPMLLVPAYGGRTARRRAAAAFPASKAAGAQGVNDAGTGRPRVTGNSLPGRQVATQVTEAARLQGRVGLSALRGSTWAFDVRSFRNGGRVPTACWPRPSG